jgi:penicillin amidase
MTGNLTREVTHAEDIRRYGIERALQFTRTEPREPFTVPPGLDLSAFTSELLRAYRETVGPVRLTTEQGSNNWVVDGTLTATGRPILANDPHRPVQLPSLRKTVHLVGPGWNAIGSGEPGLPGIALGHNENVAFGFTIVGIDQQDLYVEALNPANPDQYVTKAYGRTDRQPQQLAVKANRPRHHAALPPYAGPSSPDPAPTARARCWVGSEPECCRLSRRPFAGARRSLDRVPHRHILSVFFKNWFTRYRATSAGRWAAYLHRRLGRPAARTGRGRQPLRVVGLQSG